MFKKYFNIFGIVIPSVLILFSIFVILNLEVAFAIDIFPDWSSWSSLGEKLDPNSRMDVINNADGRLEVFALSLNEKWNLWHAWQIYITPPTINNPKTPLLFSTLAISNSTLVIYSKAISTTGNIDQNVDLNCNQPSDTYFPVAITDVTCAAKDNSGNVNTAIYKVEVRNFSPPEEGTNNEGSLPPEEGTNNEGSLPPEEGTNNEGSLPPEEGTNNEGSLPPEEGTNNEGSLPPEEGTNNEGSLPPEEGTNNEGSLPPEEGTNNEGSLPPEGNLECNELNIRNITASGFETDPSDYHPPLDAIDKDSSTWWSNKDENSWLQIDLGEINTLCGLSVEWNKGEKRQYTFLIEVSKNGIDFEEVFKGTNKFGSSQPEVYPIEEMQGQHIRLAITGTSSEQGWVSVKEVKVSGRPNP